MSLTEANLRAHDNVATWGSAPQAPRSSSVQGTTKSSMGDRRPLGSIGSITGFGSSSVSSKKGRDDATSAASSKCIAVGHGSVRPPPSRCSTSTDRAATESIAIESLEIQLDEERRIRKAMESRLENLSSMIERLSAAAPTPTPQGRRTPSAQPRSRKVTFQQK